MSTRLVGAGVLCVALDPQQEIVLLLGREREVSNWKYGSSKWCAFSGRAEEGEDALTNATREFLEESCCVVKLEEHSSLPLQASEAYASLSRAVVEERTTRSLRAEEQQLSHVTFICQVPYDDLLPKRFAETYLELSHANSIFKRYQSEKRSCEALPRAFLPGFCFGESVYTVGLRADAPGDMAVVEVFDGKADQLYSWSVRLSSRAWQEASAVAKAWGDVKVFVAEALEAGRLEHPAVNLHFERSRLVSAFVNSCYLEKTDLAWFKLSLLESSSSLFGRDFFKPRFLDSIYSIAAKIRGIFASRSPREDAQQLPVALEAPTSICVH